MIWIGLFIGQVRLGQNRPHVPRLVIEPSIKTKVHLMGQKAWPRLDHSLSIFGFHFKCLGRLNQQWGLMDG